MKIHLIAVCGTGMGALALLLKAEGHYVTGSDANVYPPMSIQLRNAGVIIKEGYKSENLNPLPDIVIVGNAVSKTNPEVAKLLELNIPYISFPSAVAKYFIKEKHTIVAAGTHGKTTTTALLSHILEVAGLSPGFLVGGVPLNFNTNARNGNGLYFVIEGDEYDTAFFDKEPKFLHYKPKSLLLTSVEFDHGDIYRDLKHLEESFSKLLGIINSDGFASLCIDYPSVVKLCKNIPFKFDTYGASSAKGNGRNHWSIGSFNFTPEITKFEILRNGKLYLNAETHLFGRYNILNIVGTVSIASNLDISIDAVSEALYTFKGVKRRQEIIAAVNGVTFIEDFAHHPTAVKETISAVKEKYKRSKIWAIFEPRSNTSRRNFFQKVYPDAFKDADAIVLADVYNKELLKEEERLRPDLIVQELKKRGKEAYFFKNCDEIVLNIAERLNRDDIVLIMSNGGFNSIYTKLPDEVRKYANS